MEFLLADGTPMYYEIQGKADAEKTLVFLNGLSQSTQAWAGIAPSFYSEYRVILTDLVFQGQSGKPAAFRSYDQHAADVYELLASLAAEQIYLCGISYGSAVAQHLLVNYPDLAKGAILLSTFAHDTPQFVAIGNSWKSAVLTGGYSLMLDVMLPVVLGKTYFEKPLIPIETLKESRVARNLETDDLIKLMRATETRGDYRSKLKSVAVPVLVAQGEEDFLIPPAVAREVADHIPGARFLLIEKAGHTLNLEAIPQTIKLIRTFLESKNEE